jgi:hypothetical protein
MSRAIEIGETTRNVFAVHLYRNQLMGVNLPLISRSELMGSIFAAFVFSWAYTKYRNRK